METQRVPQKAPQSLEHSNLFMVTGQRPQGVAVSGLLRKAGRTGPHTCLRSAWKPTCRGLWVCISHHPPTPEPKYKPRWGRQGTR